MYSIHISLDIKSRLKVLLYQDSNILEEFYINTSSSNHFYTLKQTMEIKEIWN
jgi:hypothetical protein